MGLSNDEIEAKKQEIIDFADIGDHLYQPVKTYSSGMFARLAFACAINVNPDILIVDEVLSVGDMAFQLKCFKKFEQFKSEGKTILFVSHSITDILKNCNRAVILKSGKKIFDGTTKEGVDKYKKIIAGIDEDENNNDDAQKEEIEENISKVSIDSKLSDLIEVNKDCNRYGNKKVEIIDFGIVNKDGKSGNIVYNDETINIVLKFKSNIDINNVMASFSIKDFNGLEYCGKSEIIEKVKKDEIVEIVYTQKIPLRPERYTLSFGCVRVNDEGEIEIYDRMYDCVLIQIASNDGMIGLVTLDSKVNVNKESK